MKLIAKTVDFFRNLPDQKLECWVSALISSSILYIFYIIFLYAFNRGLDPDELQHAHLGWCLTQGLELYSDIQDQHGPLFPLIISLFFSFFGDKFEILMYLKVVSILTTAATLVISSKIAKNLLQMGTPLSLFVSALIILNPIFINKAIEIRPDHLITFFLLCGFYFLKSSMRRYTFLTAFFWSLALLLHIKSLLFIAPMILFLLLSPQERNKTVKISLLLVVIVLIEAIILSYWIDWKSYLLTIVRFSSPTVLAYVAKPNIIRPLFTESYIISTAALLLSITSLAFLIRTGSNEKKRYCLLMLLALLCVSSSTMLLRKYTQWYLMILPFLSMGLVLSLQKLGKTKHLIITASLLLFVFHQKPMGTDEQLNRAKDVQQDIDRYLTKDTRIFSFFGSPKGGYYNRHSLFPFFTEEVRFIRNPIGTPEFFERLSKKIESSNFPIAVYWDGLFSFPEFETFLIKNFEPVRPSSSVWLLDRKKHLQK